MAEKGKLKTTAERRLKVSKGVSHKLKAFMACVIAKTIFEISKNHDHEVYQ